MTIPDRAVLVTGANRGIGQALVEEALRRGAKRVYAGTRQPLAHLDGRVTPLTLDVTNAAQTQGAVERVESLVRNRKSTERTPIPMKLLRVFAVSWFLSLTVISAFAQAAKYPPLGEHMMSKDAEIALAKSAPSQATETTIEQMPATLETQFALSALPPALRGQATVYLLDPRKGYQLSRQGTSGVTCLVERTVWEWADFRNGIYIPLCYDAVGTKAHLKAIMDTASLRAQGMSPMELKAEIENRYRNKTYKAPEKAGLSYMVAPVMRALGPPDMKLHTMSMPHLMFYAPNITNEDIGAVPNLSVHSSLLYPFIDRQGIAEQSYMIQLIGEAEKAKIMADEQPLLDDLCAYRDVLCVSSKKQ